MLAMRGADEREALMVEAVWTIVLMPDGSWAKEKIIKAADDSPVELQLCDEALGLYDVDLLWRAASGCGLPVTLILTI
jgi:hypothetical protein